MRRRRALAEAADLVDIASRLAPHVQPDEPAVEGAETDAGELDTAAEPVPVER